MSKNSSWKNHDEISLEAKTLLKEWAKKEKLELDYEEYYEGENAMHVPPIAEAAAPARPVVYNMPQNNLRAARNYGSNINWRLVLYIAFMLMKACAALSR